jgi:predicted GNAT family acetyltransferase
MSCDLHLIDAYFDKSDFERELATLPGVYAPPRGRLLLARHDDEPAGCVALRELDADSCEMKRMFVYPQLHGKGVGLALACRVVEEARRIGYRTMSSWSYGCDRSDRHVSPVPHSGHRYIAAMRCTARYVRAARGAVSPAIEVLEERPPEYPLGSRLAGRDGPVEVAPRPPEERLAVHHRERAYGLGMVRAQKLADRPALEASVRWP